MTRWPLAGVPLIALAVAEARATPPPIYEADHILDESWERAADAFKRCSGAAAAAGRAGSVWVDVRFPARGYPTFKLRSSPGIAAADRACVHKVVARQGLPGMEGIAWQPDFGGQVVTKELPLGTRTTYLPPLASFLPAWRELARAPANAAARARLAHRVGPLATVGSDGCLLVHREERLQPSRKHWLATGAREAPQVWKPLVERLAKPTHVRDPFLFLVDGALLVAGERFEGGTRMGHRPNSWSYTLETYCLRPLDDQLRAEVDRGIDEIATCVARTGPERLVAPRLEPPPDRKLHSLSLSDWRYCGIDQDGAIVCCGVRAGSPPAGTFSAVSVGETYGCAIRSNGELACWGDAPLRQSPPAGRFTKLHVFGGACAIDTAKSVHCWGVPSNWQEVPKGQFVDVAAGSSVISALATDGTLVAWGTESERRATDAVRVVANYTQRCLIGRTGAVHCQEAKAKGLKADLAGPFVSFAPGRHGGCGLASDGSLACDEASRLAPPPALAADRYLEIASTSDQMCAISRASRVVCWGAPWPTGALDMRPLTGALRSEPR